jgi:chromosome segregation protein
VRELLPVQAYSQKQLSSVSVRMEELTRFVTSPIRRDLATIDQRIEEISGRVRENYATLQRARQLERSVHRLSLSEASLSEQAVNLRSSLDDVNDDDRKVLGDKPKYDAASTAMESWQSAIEQGLTFADSASTAISGLVTNLMEGADFPDSLQGRLSRMRNEASRLLSELASEISSAGQTIRDALDEGSEHARNVADLADSVASFNESYEAVKARSTAHAAKLAELAEIEKQHREVGATLRSQRDELQGLGEPLTEHRRLMHLLFETMDVRSNRIATQCDSLSQDSGGLLRATLEKGRGLDAVSEQLRASVAGSNLRGARIDEFFSRLQGDENPVASWEAAVTEMEGLTHLDDDAVITSEQFPVLARLSFSPADLQRIASKLTADGWLALALTPVADHPRFEYETKQDHYIDFSAASAGQQATALLRILLAQAGPPLIIDQPEDDLDSEVVISVVEQIWDAKRHRQLIFSSHNANLVVNGDAELVVHCDYRVRGEQSRGEVKHQGAIDVPEIRDAITRVMEGGERAFRLRANKYGF